ncbi:IDEAL domain-containing protein [Bacillus kexueae]|uniref:IDEAL domain-containing protein n=1 Tax=Aeribacillus kexueae TaxID=2078952 RepID=UPI001FAF5D76|nr:IDEAL domain-containing protein [Bacillus kexueae]
MFTDFIVLSSFTHQIDCFCPCCYEDEVIMFKTGDQLILKDEHRHIPELGTYILVEVNNEKEYFISLADLESYYLQERICSFMDISLKENYLKYKIDEALKVRNEDNFRTYVQQYKQIQQLQQRLQEKKVSRIHF